MGVVSAATVPAELNKPGERCMGSNNTPTVGCPRSLRTKNLYLLKVTIEGKMKYRRIMYPMESVCQSGSATAEILRHIKKPRTMIYKILLICTLFVIKIKILAGKKAQENSLALSNGPGFVDTPIYRCTLK